MDTITGLPAHPLIVHLPVVAIPMAVIVLIVFALKPSWRQMLSYFLVALGAIIGLGVVLAASTGEGLEEQVENSALLHTHVELGEQLRNFGVVFGFLLIALGGFSWLSARGSIDLGASRSKQVITVLTALSLVMGVVTTVWDVRTGHSGAKSVWSDVEEENGSGGSQERDDDDAAVPQPQVGYVIDSGARPVTG